MKGCMSRRVIRRPCASPISAPSASISSDADRPRHPIVRDQVDEEHAEQRDHRAHRELDAAGDDHEALTDREEAEEADEVRGVGEVDRRDEARVDEGDDRADHQDQDEEPEVLLLHRRLHGRPTASWSTACSEKSSRGSMPLIAPSCITAIRSLTPITSSMSLEIIRIRHAGVGQRPHHVVDFALGADVDAAGRLVEDDGTRPHRQPLRQYDLLLVAAGERAHGRRDPRGADAEAAPLAPRPERRLRAAADDAHPGRGAELRQRDVLADRQVEHDAAGLAVLGHEVEPLGDGVPRRTDRDAARRRAARCRPPAGRCRRGPARARCVRRRSVRPGRGSRRA